MTITVPSSFAEKKNASNAADEAAGSRRRLVIMGQDHDFIEAQLEKHPSRFIERCHAAIAI